MDRMKNDIPPADSLSVLKGVLNKFKKPEPKLRIPFRPLMGQAIVEPILDEDTMLRVRQAIAPCTSPTKWKKWGMASSVGCGSRILLTGPPGTGKTTIATWIAKKVSNGIISITMADVGGGDPGDSERNTCEIFKAGRAKQNCTIHIDECDSLLWSRDKAGPDSMWMLAVVNNFLNQIETYPGVVTLATNHAHFLDPALKRRLTDTITISTPNYETRLQLWSQKIPREYPLQLSEEEASRIAREILTGAEIENCVSLEARKAICEGRNPRFGSLLSFAREMAKEASSSTTS